VRQDLGRIAPELARAHGELERFEAALVPSFGEQTAAAIRQQTWWAEDMIFGRVEVPKLSEEGEDGHFSLHRLCHPSSIRFSRKVLWGRHLTTPEAATKLYFVARPL
jgi:hypothetical protein